MPLRRGSPWSRNQHHGQRTALLVAGSTLDHPEEALKKQGGGGGEG